ncbi:hypothetical protein ABW636_03680 [Aquimarina sp. 2201CG1-2-11]|uniref:hypothetical protein n=1 Tax=Aquimarina discodermiae TaxID=3231043 RepID=UPI0034625450
MGGEGAMMQAIHSLRNNSRKKSREAFSHITGKTDKESKGIKVEPISEERLQEIRDKLRKERKLLFRKRLIVSLLIITGVIGIMIYAII